MHRYLITLRGGARIVVTGDSVYQDPSGMVVRDGDETVAELSRAEYDHVGPWDRAVPRHAAPDLTTAPEVVEVVPVTSGAITTVTMETAGGAACCPC